MSMKTMDKRRLWFHAGGFNCASCAIGVGRALERLDGILEVNISYLLDKGYVDFDAEVVLQVEVEKALRKRGFVLTGEK